MSRKRQRKQVDDISALQDGQVLCIVRGIAGANIFECWDGLADSSVVAELPPRFRKTLWIRRGSYVIVTLFENPSGDVAGKLQGEVTSVLQADQIKRWKKNGTWPPHLASKSDNTASVNEDGPLDDNLEEGNAYESDSDEDGEGEGADIPLNPNRR